jgi:membrane fusion protein, multidrug efflux system
MKQPCSNSASLARWIAVIGTVVLLIAVLFAGCSRESSNGTKTKREGVAVPVLAAQAVEKDVPVQIRAIGNVMPYSKVTIRSQITGQLQAVHFKDGQEVKKGDLLFTIDPRPPQAALEQAAANLARDEAQLENAKIAFERSRKLFDSKLISQEDFDNARASMDALQGTGLADRAAITNATLNLAYTSIRSPMDGVAGAQLVFAGNIVKSPDDEMLLINQIHPIYVSFAVPERFLSEIKNQMRDRTLKVEATSTGMTGPAPQGALTFVDNTVDTTTGMIQLKGTFANEDNALWPGQFVQVTLTLSEISNAVIVPSQAVQTGQNGQFVFVVKSDQTVETRPVTLGNAYQGETVIANGLKVGEKVVTDGQLRLVPGTKVDVKTSLSSGATTNPAAKP